MRKTADLHIGIKKSYDIHVGDHILSDVGSWIADEYESDRVAVVVDQNVYTLHGDRLKEELADNFDKVIWYVVPAGEPSKSVKEWNDLCNRLLEKQVRRTTPLVAVGGGVTGDLAGFASSTVLRGIPLIHLPTTLLAMVDSSIGGKTGINHATGKNLIGSFYQPEAVFADLSFLETLPTNEWINGVSEILKYGAISDQNLLKQCRQLTEGGTPAEPNEWEEVIAKSESVKAEIVEQDALEAGKRAYLNFGHTFAHAMESFTDYGEYAHGEAVFLGMHAALFASHAAGADLDYRRLTAFNHLYNIECEELKSDIEPLIERMYYDKKVRRNKIRLVLLQDWEQPYVTEWQDHKVLKNAWRFAFEQCNE